jgi:hypothetical protein
MQLPAARIDGELRRGMRTAPGTQTRREHVFREHAPNGGRQCGRVVGRDQ